jgi:hypothetical protein
MSASSDAGFRAAPPDSVNQGPRSAEAARRDISHAAGWGGLLRLGPLRPARTALWQIRFRSPAVDSLHLASARCTTFCYLWCIVVIRERSCLWSMHRHKGGTNRSPTSLGNYLRAG